MDASRIVFLGDTHMMGTGAEWPHLWAHIPGVPLEFRKNMWINFVRNNLNNPRLINDKFREISSNLKFDIDNDPVVLEYREKGSWQAIVAKHYNLEYINLAFPAYNLYQIAAKLMVGQSYKDIFHTEDFSDCLVILGISDMSRDLLFHSTGASNQLQNVSIPYIGITINLIKEFVEARGGKFTYFHVKDAPDHFYDFKLNPFFKVLNNFKLFDRSLYSFLTPTLENKTIDGMHYDVSVHKELADKFIKEFENSLIFSILMA